MKRNEAFDFVTEELRTRGIKFDTEKTGSNHLELRWQLPDKELRTVFLPNTPSDHRGRLNARAHVRRLLKQDGVDLAVPDPLKPRKPAALLARALALPKAHEPTTPELIRALRAEIADLTDLVLDLSGTMNMLRDHVMRQQPPPPPQKKPSVRSKNILDFLTTSWSGLDAIARDMEVDRKIVYRKCYYLRDKIDLDKDRARLKPAKPHAVHG